MMTRPHWIRTLAAGAAFAALAAAAPAALAHPAAGEAGIATPFAAGFAHPFGGLDHLLAMAAVGLIAAARGGRALWALPAAFVGLMLVGLGAGLAGVGLAAGEPFVIASVVTLGALVMAGTRLPLAALAGAVALAGLFHGHAHATPAAMAAYLPFAAGMTAATALLHAAGAAAGTVLSRARPWAGAGVAAAGLVLASGL